MKRKIVLFFCLSIISVIGYADRTVQIVLLNSSASPPIPNPIHVTGGSLTYFMSYDSPPVPYPEGCPTESNPVVVDLGTVVSVPLSISVGSESKFSFILPPSMDKCLLTTMTPATIILSITQVDGINKQSGNCSYMGYYHPLYPNDSYIALTITRTMNSFYCSQVTAK